VPHLDGAENVASVSAAGVLKSAASGLICGVERETLMAVARVDLVGGYGVILRISRDFPF
tara:strand:+ start:523 stop:702 length:180 start_codon:yes stop_codon:yes gene_type:complete